MEQLIWLIPLGFGVGVFGTIVGAGGGFILVPILLLLYPDKGPETITSISLAVVFFNALSGTFAYARMKRIDYKSGLVFAAATVPGSIFGALVSPHVPRNVFDAGVGGLLMVLALVLAFGKKPRVENVADASSFQSPKHHVRRNIIDWERMQYLFSYNPVLGVLFSLGVGFLSSLLGIGGGIIHVPILATALNFPVHVATATSHFVLSIMALAGTSVHIASGAIFSGLTQIAGLSIGVIAGAQLGAWLSNRIKGPLIVKILGVSLAFAGLRLLILAFAA